MKRTITKVVLYVLCSQTSSNPALERLNTALFSGLNVAGVFLLVFLTACVKRLKERNNTKRNSTLHWT